MANVLTLPVSNNLGDLIRGEIKTIEVTKRDEDSINQYGVEFLKIAPAFTIYSFDRDAGKLLILHYKQPDVTTPDDNGDDQVVTGKLSLTFGNAIADDPNNPGIMSSVQSQDTGIDDEGNTTFSMTLDDLLNTSSNYGMQDFEKMTGAVLNLDKYDFRFNSGFVRGDDNSDLLVVTFPVQVEVNVLNAILDSIEADPEYIEAIDLFGVNVGTLILHGDITADLARLAEEVESNHGLITESRIILDHIIRSTVLSVTSKLTYDDIVHVIAMNEDRQDTDNDQTDLSAGDAVDGSAEVSSDDTTV